MALLRVGIHGCGKVAHLHARALASLPDGKLCGVHDVRAERARAFAAQYGAVAFDDLAGLLGAVDILILCTPHPQHAPAAIAAACAGVHVLVEKPFAAKLSDCDAMMEAAERGRVTLGVVSQRRFYPPVERIKAAITAGKIGKPILGAMVMLSWRDEAYYSSDPWRGKWSTEGGGVLVNQSPHQLDILQWMMGPVAEVSAYWGNLNHPYIEVEDTVVASLRFANGGLGSIMTSVSQKPGIYTKVHIHGSNGASVGAETDSGASWVAGMSGISSPPFNDVWTIPGEEHLPARFAAEDAEAIGGADATVHYHTLQVRDFLQAVAGNRPPAITGAEGRGVVALIDAIYRSNGERQPVAVLD